jgi:hypothetical protein
MNEKVRFAFRVLPEYMVANCLCHGKRLWELLKAVEETLESKLVRL